MYKKEYGVVQLEDIVLNAVRFEIATADKWGQIINESWDKIKAHKKAAEAVKSLQMKVGAQNQKMASEYDKAESRKIKEKISSLAAQLKEAKRVCKDALDLRNAYERGSLTIELKRYTSSRAQRMKELKDGLVAMHVNGADMLKSIWDDKVRVCWGDVLFVSR